MKNGIELKTLKNAELLLRLTMGFQKIEGHWWISHEHHSYPIK
ncbi:nuclear transport factor 2 family protein [Galbibacter sp. EGI 63066]|nr:nuclear transport factor 2 family protein [Galbibacter sp. EGI 63066]MCX2679780.1 nuclear transport factor 2 family protein [Galbibacter sp. EGI 63066]